jgi:hypothetical protein
VLTNISPKGKTMSTFIGYSSNVIPYAKLSENGPALVAFSRSELEHQPPTWTARQGFRVGLKRLAGSFKIESFNFFKEHPASRSR